MNTQIADGPYAWTFPCDRRSVRESRQFTSRLLNDMGLSAETAELAELLVSEAVTNGIVHAGTKVRVAWSRLFCQRLCCEVTDYAAGLPRRVSSGPYAERGRGMFLIEELALATRVVSTPSGGTTVRFMLAEEKR